jgi:two-component system, NarL family, sensor histidine kinase DesK
MRLLPKDPHIGWLPYLWLTYLGPFVGYAVLLHRGWRWWLLDGLALAAYLALYFAAYRVKGRRLVLVVAGLGGLGALSLPWNPAAASFFVVAAAFAGDVGRASTAIKLVVGLMAVFALEAPQVGLDELARQLPPRVWSPFLSMILLVGAAKITLAERGRANERLRLAQQEVEQLAKLAERERIARDLHDLLGHTLSVIVLKAELAVKLTERDLGRARQEIGDVARISRAALAEVRQAVTGFRRVTFEEALVRAREALLAAQVDCEARVESVALSSPVEGVLSLVLREAVTNIVRHARATRCEVRLCRATDRVRLEVVDDGVGGVRATGTGLEGMRERVEALGGHFEHDGRSGTRVTAELPLAMVAA